MWDDPRTADIPVLLCSADQRALDEQAVLLHQRRCGMLAKPFDLDHMVRQVNTLLAEPEATRTPPTALLMSLVLLLAFGALGISA